MLAPIGTWRPCSTPPNGIPRQFQYLRGWRFVADDYTLAARDLGHAGRVAASSRVSHWIASAGLSPHISPEGRRTPQNAGRAGPPQMRQRLLASSWTQGTPAGLPFGIPGIGLVIDGAMQHAPQPGRHG